MECNLLCKYSVIQRLFFIFLLLSIYKRCETEDVEECDFVKCATYVETVIHGLRNPKTYFDCRHLFNSPWCSEHCISKYYPNIPPDTNVTQPSFTRYCQFSYRDANWSCIARHSIQLLTCLANVSTLTTNNVHEDIMLAEMCRKSLEFQNCPNEVLLHNCGEHSVKVVKGMLQFIIKNFMKLSCKEAVLKEASSMPVYYQLGYEYKEAAISMDYYYNYVRGCFGSIQEEYDLNEFMCVPSDEESVTDCVSYILSVREKSFPHVKRLLLKIFSLGGFTCKQSVMDPQSSLELKTLPSYKMDLNNHDVLKDANDDFSNIPETSTVFSLKNTDDTFHHKEPTEKFVNISLVKSLTKKINQKIPTKDFSEEEIGDSHVKNSSKSQTSHNINYLKTSSAFNLHYDRTLCILLLLFLFACVFFCKIF